MKAHIIYANFLKPDGEGLNIGGIETYIKNLAYVFNSLCYEVHIYQRGDLPFNKHYDNYFVHGVVRNNVRKFKYDIFNACKANCDRNNDIIVFASEDFIVDSFGYYTIGIQHGIAWDIPTAELSQFKYLTTYISKAIKAWIRIHRVNKLDTLVCVDYNFINWYRALTAYPKTRLKAIPNFTDIPNTDAFSLKSDDSVEIIFARRFQQYRGTRVFATAIRRILNEYPNVKVTFAGEGPDELYLKKIFENETRVSMIKYNSGESIAIHSTKHIAVVPTVGSEGTSLSLLEAMAAKCAVIASNVGGMTNIILDHYNGLLINSDSDSIYNALRELLDNASTRKEIAQKAFETVSSAFSLTRWQQAWSNIIKDIKNK